MTIRDLLEILSFIAQIISFPAAAISIYLSRKEAKAARDVQIALTLSDSFRKNWETGWEDVLTSVNEIQKNQPDTKLPLEDEKKLRYMLNWLDWLGTFIKTECFSQPETILGSIRPRIIQIINNGRYIVENDIREHGEDYWSGLLALAEKLKIDWNRLHISKIDELPAETVQQN